MSIKNKKQTADNKGFTLVELIIVVAIIAMLIAMIAPNLTGFLDTASDTTMEANAKTSYTSVNAWVTQKRVAGVGLETMTDDNPLVISLNEAGTDLQIAGLVSDYSNMTTYTELLDLFNAGEFSETTEVYVWITSDYKVELVTWLDRGVSASYPE